MACRKLFQSLVSDAKFTDDLLESIRAVVSRELMHGFGTVVHVAEGKPVNVAPIDILPVQPSSVAGRGVEYAKKADHQDCQAGYVNSGFSPPFDWQVSARVKGYPMRREAEMADGCSENAMFCQKKNKLFCATRSLHPTAVDREIGRGFRHLPAVRRDRHGR